MAKFAIGFQWDNKLIANFNGIPDIEGDCKVTAKLFQYDWNNTSKWLKNGLKRNPNITEIWNISNYK